MNVNAVPYGAAFLPQNQDPTTGAELHARRDVAGGELPASVHWLRQHQHAVLRRQLELSRLQLQADRRFSGGLFLNVNYTFSKALDTQSGNADFSRIDANDKAANYGPANYDRRHIFNLNWVYELPRKESAGRSSAGSSTTGSCRAAIVWRAARPTASRSASTA